MAYLNDTNILTEECLLVWDGLSKPDTKESTGELEYRLDVAVKQGSVTHQELQASLDRMTAAKYPTGKPAGFKEALKPFDSEKYPELVGYLQVRAKSNSPCDIYLQAKESSAAEFGAKAYAGCGVRVILSPSVYMPSKETKNTTGAKFWLNGAQLTNLGLPKLSVAAGLTGREVANAFGANPSAGTAFNQPAPAATVTPPTPAQAAVVPAPNPGILAAGAPVPPAPPTPPAPPVAAGPVATAALTAIGQTVESMLAAGWSMEQLKAQNYVA